MRWVRQIRSRQTSGNREPIDKGLMNDAVCQLNQAPFHLQKKIGNNFYDYN
jgi:hypothetical protein